MEKDSCKNVQENLKLATGLVLNLTLATFHNILICNRAIFNKRVACCVDFEKNPDSQ